ncbi:MAG: hypothetical protein JKX98_06645 [Alcanivoracaceae bacterium]|nr:hypothetical protein [Alcanivoracaceae bacterium]
MNIELTVAFVGFGGNIGDGEYFYSYSPNVIIVEALNEPLNFQFSKETANNFVMKQIITTDANNQFSKATKAPDGRSMQTTDSNSNPQLTLMSILVEDQTRAKLISCDPQILNVPD